MACNWAQCMEGDLDDLAFSFLHGTQRRHGQKPARAGGWRRRNGAGRRTHAEILYPRAQEVGFVEGGARATDEARRWRPGASTSIQFAGSGTGPSALPGETYYGFTLVPISDESCWMYCYGGNPDRPLGGAAPEPSR